MRRSRCASCKILSEDTTLRWAGSGKGYISLCDKCASKHKAGKLKTVMDSEGRLKVVKS